MPPANGAVATVQATTAAYPGFAKRFELNCTRGTTTLEAGQLQVAFTDGKTLTPGTRPATGGGANPMNFNHATHRAVMSNFIRAVRGGTVPTITGHSAVGVQRLIAPSNTGASVSLQSFSP